MARPPVFWACCLCAYDGNHWFKDRCSRCRAPAPLTLPRHARVYAQWRAHAQLHAQLQTQVQTQLQTQVQTQLQTQVQTQVPTQSTRRGSLATGKLPVACATADANVVDDGFCCICLTRKAVYTVVHGGTGHTCLCGVCKPAALVATQDCCPICRQKSAAVIRCIGT
jgi:hypothetical protein